MTSGPSPRNDHEALAQLLSQVLCPIDRLPPELSALSVASVQSSLRSAAVLFPLTWMGGRVQAVLTVRNASLRSHPGQISFPGGKVDAGDADFAATAVREASEEIGLAPQDVTVLGALGECLTGTGYRVVPVIGVIPPGYPFQPDAAEVAEVFQVPLAYLLDASRHQRLSREFEGVRREYYAIDYGRYHIWGATARMIVDLHERLRGHSATGIYKKLFGNCDIA